MISYSKWVSTPHVVRVLSVLWGAIRFKDASPARARRASQTSHEVRLTLLWTVAVSISYTSVYGHHLQIEGRFLWFSIDTGLHYYPSLP